MVYSLSDSYNPVGPRYGEWGFHQAHGAAIAASLLGMTLTSVQFSGTPSNSEVCAAPGKILKYHVLLLRCFLLLVQVSFWFLVEDRKPDMFTDVLTDTPQPACCQAFPRGKACSDAHEDNRTHGRAHSSAACSSISAPSLVFEESIN